MHKALTNNRSKPSHKSGQYPEETIIFYYHKNAFAVHVVKVFHDFNSNWVGKCLMRISYLFQIWDIPNLLMISDIPNCCWWSIELQCNEVLLFIAVRRNIMLWQKNVLCIAISPNDILKITGFFCVTTVFFLPRYCNWE